MTACEAVAVGAALELFWPYIAYCSAVTVGFATALWRLGESARLEGFATELRTLLARALVRMLLKAIWVWLLGGSIVLSIGTWLCEGVIQADQPPTLGWLIS